MKFKDSSIGLQSLCPQMVLGLIVLDGVFIKHGVEMVITSVNDSKHDEGYSHYRGMGADIRSKTVVNKEQFINDCKAALGHNPDFYIVLESIGKIWEHFHFQYKPKRRSYHA